MTLIVPVPPESALAAARVALEPAGGPLTEGIASVRTFSLSAPHSTALAVYVLGVADLLAGHNRAAQLVAWQHIVRHADSGRAATAETIPLTSGDHAVGRVSDDPPFLAETLAAVDAASRLSADTDYELRLMIIPAVYAQAVWLMNTTEAEGDRFIVVNAGEIFEPGTEVTAAVWYDAWRDEIKPPL